MRTQRRNPSGSGEGEMEEWRNPRNEWSTC
jgi:hypothetical protein